MDGKGTVVVFIFCLGLASVFGLCDIGWAEFKEDCLWFSKSQNSWLRAEADCRSKGAYLATDDNEDKHEFIATILNVLRDWNANIWFIGGSDYTIEGSYRWLETGSHVGPFTRWAPGQPNGTMGENCISLKWLGRDLMWTDEPCDRPHVSGHHHVNVGVYYYICEKPNNVTSPPVIGR